MIMTHTVWSPGPEVHTFEAASARLGTAKRSCHSQKMRRLIKVMEYSDKVRRCLKHVRCLLWKTSQFPFFTLPEDVLVLRPWMTSRLNRKRVTSQRQVIASTVHLVCFGQFLGIVLPCPGKAWWGQFERYIVLISFPYSCNCIAFTLTGNYRDCRCSRYPVRLR